MSNFTFFPKKSFVIGFGNNYPKRPHHASSSCPVTSATCDIDSPDPNPNLLQGALVGGPDAEDDQYVDIRTGNLHKFLW